jgi:hypothetical protein
MKPWGRTLAVCLVAATPAFSQERPAAADIDYETAHLSRIAAAVRISEKITVDGRLDEPAWERATPVGNFIQRRPRTGAPMTERTDVRFLYDDDNLYVSVFSFDSDPAGIIVNSVQRDYQTQESDGVTVLIDSLHDRRSGFTFVANPLGAKRDVQLSNDGSGNLDWDGVWDVKTSRNDQGWIAEFVIPFTTLRFSSSPSQEWGLQITRRITRKNEEADWSPLPQRFSNWRMSMAGTLTGLENIRQGRNLKVKPFVSSGITQSRSASGGLQTLRGFERFKDYDGGLDVKYGLSPSLTLDATFRTDFAQVEADQQQVNLTRFNLFFPEKREFFLENSGTFNFGAGSGSGGGGGNLVPFFSRRIGLSASGTPIPIVGGARVSGSLDRFDVGVLTMRTESLGSTPSNTFLVGRVKRNISTSSWIGALMTNRDSARAGDYNRVAGADAHFQFLHKLDFDAYLLGSDTPGRTGANLARRFQAGWTDEELVATAEYSDVQPDFNPEVGFVRRRDMKNYTSELAWKPQLRQSDLIRNFNIGTTVDYYEGSGSGEIETRVTDTTLGIVFESNANASFVYSNTFDRLTTPLPIPAGTPHVTLARGDYTFDRYTAQFSTNQRKKISGSGTLSAGDFYGGDRTQATAAVTLKPNYHLSMNLSYDRNQVDLPNGSFTTQLVGAKFIYGFSPRAFLNAFLQYNADTRLVSSNIRFDLIHRPLSDLYIVYNDTRDTALGQVRERAFVVKLTNLFTF